MNILEHVIIENERDKRVYEWLIANFKEEQIALAITNIKGNKKPYLTNIIKNLNSTVPNSVIKTPKKVARKNLAQIIKYIAEKN